MDITQASGLTPLMKQYVSLKNEYQDSILLFQVGDFYEIFFDDAKKVSEFLGIALTKRGEVLGEPIPLCGFPIHAVNHYIPKLVKGGFKVALCDQLEPATTGKMVLRGITNVLTPGTLTSDVLLDAKSNSYLFSFFPTKTGYGLLFSELLTSQLYGTVLPYGSSKQLESELFRFLPDEVLLLQNRAMAKYTTFFRQSGFYTTEFQADFDTALIEQETTWLLNQFDKESARYLLQESSLLYATILWKKYLQKNQQGALDSFKTISWYEPESFLMLDAATQKNLDLVKNSFDGSRSHTLLSFVDKAVTPMGSRMIKQWVLAPLLQKDLITQRQEVIKEFLAAPVIFNKIVDTLHRFSDMQRIIGRIALDKALFADYLNLKNILLLLPELIAYLSDCSCEQLRTIKQAIADFTHLYDLLNRSCNDDANSDWIIKKGYDKNLDHMRDLVANSSQKILDLEREEIQKTGISSLKIRHNGIQGYYIEITKTHVQTVPDYYIEGQTLVNRKRYTTRELQALQYEIVQAQNSYQALEKELFNEVKDKVRLSIHDLRATAKAVAMLDALVGFARVSSEWGYVCPEFHESRDIIIKNGRHPVIAATMADTFIPNDTQLTDDESLWVITGPNMGGKSTYLRQVALICLLGQTGCFVPATSAQLPILDRIFTRIGAGDYLAQGKSTFLVEMEETAQICMQATDRSFVILDEVGRGTSTYDGLAIAQAVVEYILYKIKARCLFATHYHELTHLQNIHHGIVSYYMDSQKTSKGIIFLHKILPGNADGSFGIEVAQLAGIPDLVISRARDLLRQLGLSSKNVEALEKKNNVECYSLHVNEHQIHLIKALQDLDLDSLTPRQAHELLWKLKDLSKE